MKKQNVEQYIYKITLKKRSMKFHIILTFLTLGIWAFFYFLMKLSYKINNKNSEQYYSDYKKNKIINSMDYGTVISLQRDGKFRQNIGKCLVQVTTHGNTCEKCKKWEGKILTDDLFSNGRYDGNHQLLSEAIKDGLFHNGCRHGLSTYYPELENIENETEEEYQKDLEYINKKINKILKK